MLSTLALIFAIAPGARSMTMTYGDVTIKPEASLDEKYDSNIFLAPGQDARDSAITAFHIGSGFAINGARQRLNLFYDFGMERYGRFSSANDADVHTASVDYKYDLANGGNVGAGDKFIRTADPASSEFTTRALRNENNANAGGEIQFGEHTFANLNVRHMVEAYDDQSLANILNRRELWAGAKVGYNLTPKTRTYVGYQYGVATYDLGTVRNNNTNIISVGAEGDFLTRLTGGVDAGVLVRTYNTTAAGTTSNTTTPSFGAHLSWAAPSDFTVAINAYRSLQESSFNRYFEDTFGGVSVSKKLPMNITTALNVGYDFNHYPDAQTVGTKTAQRDDTLFTVGLSAKYTIKDYYNINAGYMYRNRVSNFDAFGYDDYIATLGVGMAF